MGDQPRAGFGQVLAVVDHQQQKSRRQIARQRLFKRSPIGFMDAQAVGDKLRHQSRIDGWRKIASVLGQPTAVAV